jgi:hypothetical protein
MMVETSLLPHSKRTMEVEIRGVVMHVTSKLVRDWT